MVDQEVADILAEIKNKVRSANESREAAQESFSPIDLERIATNGFAGLPVLSRAADRLPPLVTNRTGTLARIDLWLKGKLKRALRWLTWEQVNFNTATLQTFIEVIEALQQQKNYLSKLSAEFQSYQQELETQHANFLYEVRVRKEQLEHLQTAFNTQLDHFSSQLAAFSALTSDLKARIDSVKEQQVSSDKLVADLENSHGERIESIEERFFRLVSEHNALVGEFHGRDERLFDELRVSLKQFSLEIGESQVLHDRARRELEARIAKLEQNKK